MDPVTIIVVPGFLGGLALAAVVIFLQRRGRPAPSLYAPFRRDPISTDVINMASIKVAGVGGLGLVAMAAAVALDVPRIAQSVGVGIAFGVVIAVVMIVRRRRSGSMPSSGQRLGANTMLSIDVPQPNGNDGRGGQDVRRHDVLPALTR